jgi:Uma2 family endonuclease
MPEMPDVAAFTLAPDWVCEVLSPSTMDHDRGVKMPLYAQQGVRFAWLVDPIACLLEVYVLGEAGRFRSSQRFQGSAEVRAEPFDAIALDLALLWAR